MTRRTALLLFALCFTAGLGAAHACSKDQIIKWTDERDCKRPDAQAAAGERGPAADRAREPMRARSSHHDPPRHGTGILACLRGDNVDFCKRGLALKVDRH